MVDRICTHVLLKLIGIAKKTDIGHYSCMECDNWGKLENYSTYSFDNFKWMKHIVWKLPIMTIKIQKTEENPI